MDGTPTVCTNCGTDRGLRPPSAPPPTPCPNCGSRAISLSVTLAASATSSAAANPSIAIGQPPSGSAWLVRWNDLVARLATVTGMQHAQLSSVAVRQAALELLDFIVSLFHFEDLMYVEEAALQLGTGAVASAIKRESTLDLVADVANTQKHVKLTRKLRSAGAPTFGPAFNKHPTPMDPAWTVSIHIDHCGKDVEADQLASEAMDCWWSILTGWNLPAQRPQ